MKSVFAAPLGAVMASMVAVSAHATVLSDWNLVVRNDINLTSEVDGSALVGGNVIGTGNFAVHFPTAPNGDGLSLAGNITAGSTISVNSGGNFRLAGTNGGTVNVNGGITITDPTVGSVVTGAMTEAETISAALAGLTPNGTLDGAGNLNATPVAMGGFNVAVYSIQQSDITGLGQLNLNMGTADSVVINFTGASANLQAPPNMVGAFNQANSSRIIWNFIDATDLVVNNNLNGAVLAPDADLRLLGGGINGAVVVDNISALNAEIRESTYDGYVPAPGAGMTLLAGALVAARRRRRA